MSYTDDEVAEIFGLAPNITGRNYAGNAIENVYSVVEFTLNHPHTKAWEKLGFTYKFITYMNWFEKAKQSFRHMIVDSQIRFEDANGHIHAHGYLKFQIPHLHSGMGLVCLLVQNWLDSLPKRYNHCLKGNVLDNYDAHWHRVCIPQCCLYYRFNEPERQEEWVAYINKAPLALADLIDMRVINKAPRRFRYP